MGEIVVNRALDNTFSNFTIKAINTDIEADVESSLVDLLETPILIIEKCLEQLNCFKFYIVCEATFQVKYC